MADVRVSQKTRSHTQSARKINPCDVFVNCSLFYAIGRTMTSMADLNNVTVLFRAQSKPPAL